MLLTTLSVEGLPFSEESTRKMEDSFFEDIEVFLDEVENKEIRTHALPVLEIFPKSEKVESFFKEDSSLIDEDLSKRQKHQRAEDHAKVQQQGSIPSGPIRATPEEQKPRPGVPIVQSQQKSVEMSQPLKELAEQSPSSSLAHTSPMEVKSEMAPSRSKDPVYGTPGYNMPELSIHRRGANIILAGSFIYWRPEQDNFDLGITGPRPFVGQRVEPFHSKYEPGFKAEIGVNSSYDNWTACLEYTQLKTHQSNSRTANDQHPMILSPWVSVTEKDQSISYPFSSPASEILHSSVTNSWHFNFEMLDLELSRSYYVGKKLIFNPSLTARGAKIYQTLNVNFMYNTEGSRGVQNVIESHNKNNTQQIGPRFGLDMKWLIGSSFRFGGTVAGALLYTHYQLQHTETLNGINHANIYSDRHAFRLNYDVGLEFGWRAYMSRHRRYIDCSFKYEAVVFCGQNGIAGLSAVTTNQGRVLDSGNLYLHGGTFKLEFNF